MASVIEINFSGTTNFVNINTATPPGMCLLYFATDEPEGFFLCDGRAVSRTVYADLFDILGTRYGVGDGSTTFNIPDTRGYFLRGWDNGRGIDSGRALDDTVQADATKSGVFGTGPAGAHSHNLNSRYSDSEPGDGQSSFLTDDQYYGQWPYCPTPPDTTFGYTYGGVGTLSHTHPSISNFNPETRPKNFAVNYIIKY